MKSADDECPKPVALLGYGGLLPFIGTAAGAWLDQAHQDTWLFALLAYAALIASFVGALHWAFAMTPPSRGTPLASRSFCWSVVPALIAWLALLVAHLSRQHGSLIALLLLAAVFLLHYLRDRALALHHPLPSWYLPLRFRLSGVACSCLIVSSGVAWWRT
jgi:Ca2+/Na+ antiporter